MYHKVAALYKMVSNIDVRLNTRTQRPTKIHDPSFPSEHSDLFGSFFVRSNALNDPQFADRAFASFCNISFMSWLSYSSSGAIVACSYILWACRSTLPISISCFTNGTIICKTDSISRGWAPILGSIKKCLTHIESLRFRDFTKPAG